MSDLRDLIADSLRRNGFDGLYNEDGGCGCALDELMPCESSAAGLVGCKPALERVCPRCGSTIYVTANRGRKVAG